VKIIIDACDPIICTKVALMSSQ